MNIVSRIRFPRTPETSGLYIKCNEEVSLNFNTDKTEASFVKNGILSLNTYFNSFYEKFYAQYTELDSLYYLLKLEGNFQISLYREFADREHRELVQTASFENCQASEPVKICFPDSWRSDNVGRTYLEIICLSDRGSFTGGHIVTEQPKIREVSLGIITCTFKKEFYVKETVNLILQDEHLQNKNFNIFVVDNGQTLNKHYFNNSRVQLIFNRNVGGAGGFTRGLIQALQDDTHTHFLFMDDDIELETESIYRLFILYEYAHQEIGVSGSMLDLYKKHILYEAGAVYGQEISSSGNYRYNPFGNISLKSKLNLEKPSITNFLLVEDNPDYGAFWFFSFSKKIIEKIGLLLPLFIKGDDIEFGLRIKKHFGNVLVAFPGIAVWHEPFYAKHPVWTVYYEIRNRLITHSIQGTLGYINAVIFLTKRMFYPLFIFDYNSAELIVDAFEHYLLGPEFIKTNDPELLHSTILNRSKKHQNQTIQYNPQVNKQSLTKSTIGKFKKILAIVSLNGHLLPDVLIRDEGILHWFTPEYVDPWYKSFAMRRVYIFREVNNCLYKNEMIKSIGIGIFIRWLKLVIKGITRWSYINLEWKNTFNIFTSINFWKDYLHLNEQIDINIKSNILAQPCEHNLVE